MLNAINKHLSEIGLERIIDIPLNKSQMVKAISEIESYIGHALSSNIKSILKKYQGMSFSADAGYVVSIHIPILGDSDFLEFGVFLTLEDSPYKILSILINNEDLFDKTYLPIAELTPGDYLAINLNDESIYFISHDYDEKTERCHYKIAESAEQYFSGLIIKKDETSKRDETPKIQDVSYTDDLLKMAEKFKKNGMKDFSEHSPSDLQSGDSIK